MIGEYQSSSSSSSLFKDQARLVKPSMCLSSCFSTGSTVHHEVLIENDEDRVRSPRSPYAWLKSTAQELPEIRDRCWNLISRFRRSRRQHHNSSDFSYDLSSYALNFEDEYSRDDESFPFRNFSSRLPVSPPPQPASAKYVSGCAAVRREIVGFS